MGSAERPAVPLTKAPRPSRPRGGGRGGREPRARIVGRECRAWELSLAGHTQREIALAVGVSQPAVCKMLQRQEARAFAALVDGDQRLQRQVALRMDYVYRQNVTGWHASRGEHTTKRQRRVDGHGVGVGAAQTMQEAVVQTSAGDPRFLQNARRDLEALQHMQLPAVSGPLDDERPIDPKLCSTEELLALRDMARGQDQKRRAATGQAT